jgi:hypothetical protein
MQLIEPAILWGTLAVAIPIAIHFWHQKQGKPLPWAATQWLTEKQQQQSRGLRLDNIFLLIIRCLLLILLAILLAQPLLNWFTQPPPIQKVHLVQPNEAVADNFRFELTEAQKKGERVIWADADLAPMDDKPYTFQKPIKFDALSLQTAINQLDRKNTDLHLYLTNTEKVADVPAITVPTRFHLHSVIDSTNQSRAYLLGKDNRKLFINRAGKLSSSPLLDPTLKFQSAPVHSGPIHTLLDYRNEREKLTVKAALASLTDVYGLAFQIDDKPIPNRRYDWVLTDKHPVTPAPSTFYISSGTMQQSSTPNVIFTNESLTPQTSERVANGQLPEWLGEQLIRHYELTTNKLPLSQQDLNALFIPSTKPATEQQAGIQNALLLLLIGLIVLERWLALTKNA